MAVQILMPALSPTMTEGKLAKWLKAEGDSVAAGDIIAEIETDKATMEFEAVDEGVLGKILVPEGTEGVAVNTPIGVLLEEGEDASALSAAPAPAPASPASAPAPAPSAPVSSVPAQAPSAPAGGERLRSSPLARRLAQEAGIDLASLSGSGPRGRIIKADVEKAKASPRPAVAASASAPAAVQKPAAPAPVAAVAAPKHQPLPDQPTTAHPNSSMRKVIAKRLLESKQSVPHFYLTIDCRLDALLALRAELNGRAGADYKLSVNDFIVKAVALALRKVPEANAMWTDEAILTFDNVDVSVAVATDGGLITPILRKADQKGLATLSNEMKDLAKKARDGKLKPEEFQGGGFTISNLGMFGIREFAAIINPPQSCILAVGAGEKRPVVNQDGALAVATMMTCTLSVDHRSVDGAVGARFLAAFKPLIEDPLQLML